MARSAKSTLLVHLLIDAAAGSNFELLRPRSSSSWRHRVSILPRVMYKTRFQSFCPFSSPQRLSKWFRLIPWSVLLQRGAVSSCFRIPPPKFLLPSNVLLLVRSVQRVCGHCSQFRMARNWTAMRAAFPCRLRHNSWDHRQEIRTDGYLGAAVSAATAVGGAGGKTPPPRRAASARYCHRQAPSEAR